MDVEDPYGSCCSLFFKKTLLIILSEFFLNFFCTVAALSHMEFLEMVREEVEAERMNDPLLDPDFLY